MFAEFGGDGFEVGFESAGFVGGLSGFVSEFVLCVGGGLQTCRVGVRRTFSLINCELGLEIAVDERLQPFPYVLDYWDLA